MNQEIYDKVIKHIKKRVLIPCPKAELCGIRYPDNGIWASVTLLFKVPKTSKELLDLVKESLRDKCRSEVYPLVQGSDEYFLVVTDAQMTAHYLGIPLWEQG